MSFKLMFQDNKLSVSDLKRYFNWIESLNVGDIVKFAWTNSGYAFVAKAKITKINQKSFIGELEESVENLSHTFYEKGQRIKCVRAGWKNVNWSWGNTVLPLGKIENRRS